MHQMIAICRKLNDPFPKSPCTATACAAMYDNADTYSELVLAYVMEHFQCGQEEAKLFLKRIINLPRKQRGGVAKHRVDAVTKSSSSEDATNVLKDLSKGEPIAVRASITLHAVQPHLIEANKKRVIPTLFSAVDLIIRTVSLIHVLR